MPVTEKLILRVNMESLGDVHSATHTAVQRVGGFIKHSITVVCRGIVKSSM